MLLTSAEIKNKETGGERRKAGERIKMEVEFLMFCTDVFNLKTTEKGSLKISPAPTTLILSTTHKEREEEERENIKIQEEVEFP